VKRTLAALGIARRSYYRWLKEEAWAKDRPTEAPRPVPLYEALSEEQHAVLAYARKHPDPYVTGNWPGGWWTRTWRT